MLLDYKDGKDILKFKKNIVLQDFKRYCAYYSCYFFCVRERYFLLKSAQVGLLYNSLCYYLFLGLEKFQYFAADTLECHLFPSQIR